MGRVQERTLQKRVSPLANLPFQLQALAVALAEGAKTLPSEPCAARRANPSEPTLQAANGSESDGDWPLYTGPQASAYLSVLPSL